MFKHIANIALRGPKSRAAVQTIFGLTMMGLCALSAGCAGNQQAANPFKDFIHVTVKEVPSSKGVNNLVQAAWPRVTIKTTYKDGATPSIDVKAGMTRGLVNNPNNDQMIWVPASRDRYGRYYPAHYEYVPY